MCACGMSGDLVRHLAEKHRALPSLLKAQERRAIKLAMVEKERPRWWVSMAVREV